MHNSIKIVHKYIPFKIMGDTDLTCKYINIFVTCTRTDDKPYWFDVAALISEYSDLATKAFNSMKTAGQKWVHEKLEEGEDAVMKFSKGKVSTVIINYLVHYEICLPVFHV